VDDPQDLVEGLSLLSDALDDPATDLQAILDVLTDDLAAAVPGYLGLTMAVQAADNPVVVTTLDIDDNTDVTATLMLPLLPLAGITGSVIFYSRIAGAFLSLVLDAAWIFNVGVSAALDGHLPTTTTTATATTPARAGRVGIHGLTAQCAVNQAIGVLITDGFTVPAARAELRRRATRNGQTLSEAADQLMRDLGDPHDDGGKTERP
jgi:hypothetical protein